MPTVPDSHRPLLDGPVATLATIGPDGRPQQSVVWFLADGDTIKLSLSDSRQKTKNLQRTPGVDLLILDPTNNARYLEVRGDARLEPDPDYVFADQVGAKYGGADLRAHDGPGQSRFVVTIEPTRINAFDLSAG